MWKGGKLAAKRRATPSTPSDGSDLVTPVMPEEEHRGQTSAFGRSEGLLAVPRCAIHPESIGLAAQDHAVVAEDHGVTLSLPQPRHRRFSSARLADEQVPRRAIDYAASVDLDAASLTEEADDEQLVERVFQGIDRGGVRKERPMQADVPAREVVIEERGLVGCRRSAEKRIETGSRRHGGRDAMARPSQTDTRVRRRRRTLPDCGRRPRSGRRAAERRR